MPPRCAGSLLPFKQAWADEQSDPANRSRRSALCCANGTGSRPVRYLGGAAVDLRRLCRRGTSLLPDKKACCPWG